MVKNFICIIIIFLITGCSTKPKEKTLDLDLFVNIYVELVLQSVNPTEADSLDPLQMALDKFGVSREEFEASINYFESNPKLWLNVFTKVINELEVRKELVNKTESEKMKKPMEDESEN
ncbi:MAG: hypothetical protein ACE5JB_02630 [bacterium]